MIHFFDNLLLGIFFFLLTQKEIKHKSGTADGFVERPNEQWKDAENQQVLVIFQGPHCYISPTWYETTQAVPTWNYVSIHLYGKLEIIEDRKVIFDSLNGLVNKYESPDSPYHLNDVEPGLIEGMSKAIVAFRIKIIKLKRKLN